MESVTSKLLFTAVTVKTVVYHIMFNWDYSQMEHDVERKLSCQDTEGFRNSWLQVLGDQLVYIEFPCALGMLTANVTCCVLKDLNYSSVSSECACVAHCTGLYPWTICPCTKSDVHATGCTNSCRFKAQSWNGGRVCTQTYIITMLHIYLHHNLTSHFKSHGQDCWYLTVLLSKVINCSLMSSPFMSHAIAICYSEISC